LHGALFDYNAAKNNLARATHHRAGHLRNWRHFKSDIRSIPNAVMAVDLKNSGSTPTTRFVWITEALSPALSKALTHCSHSLSVDLMSSHLQAKGIGCKWSPMCGRCISSSVLRSTMKMDHAERGKAAGVRTRTASATLLGRMSLLSIDSQPLLVWLVRSLSTGTGGVTGSVAAVSCRLVMARILPIRLYRTTVVFSVATC
jgi:hypothetical protein